MCQSNHTPQNPLNYFDCTEQPSIQSKKLRTKDLKTSHGKLEGVGGGGGGVEGGIWPAVRSGGLHLGNHRQTNSAMPSCSWLSMHNLTMRLTPRIAYFDTIKNADISLDHMKRYTFSAILLHWIISSDKDSVSWWQMLQGRRNRPPGLQCCTGFSAQWVTSCTGFSAQWVTSCTGFSAQWVTSCTGFSAQWVTSCTGFSAQWVTSCTGFSAQWVTSCTGFSAQWVTSCTGFSAQWVTSCTGFSAQWVTSCTGFSAQWVTPCTGFSAQWVTSCTGFSAQWVTSCTGFSAQWVTSCTGFSAQWVTSQQRGGSAGRASDKKQQTGSVLQRIFPPSQLSAQTLSRCPYSPYAYLHAQ